MSAAPGTVARLPAAIAWIFGGPSAREGPPPPASAFPMRRTPAPEERGQLEDLRDRPRERLADALEAVSPMSSIPCTPPPRATRGVADAGRTQRSGPRRGPPDPGGRDAVPMRRRGAGEHAIREREGPDGDDGAGPRDPRTEPSATDAIPAARVRAAARRTTRSARCQRARAARASSRGCPRRRGRGRTPRRRRRRRPRPRPCRTPPRRMRRRAP